jgi:hypothetical protein
MPQQKIFTAEIIRKLQRNAAAQQAGGDPDPVPVVKVFNPYGAHTWLFTELHEDGRLFGLCDMGMGEPELGYADRAEIEALRVRVGQSRLPLERDAWFQADKTLRGYADDARARGRIAA